MSECTGTNTSRQEPSLGFLLNDVARLLRRNFNRKVQDLNLTQTQWQALAHISRNPGMRQNQLADLLEVQPISVARLIDRMEAAGWVKRCADPTDRRAVNLHLSVKADPILKKMKKVGTDIRTQALAGLPPDTHQMMMDYLLVMRKNLADEDG